MDGALDAAALEEAETEVGVLRVSHLAFELVFAVRVPFGSRDDTASVFLLPQTVAAWTSPAVDTVDFERRVAPSVVVEDPACSAWDSGC